MIFRTGSVLIVGNCDIIYTFLKKILRDEYANICIQNNTTIKKKTAKKIRKKTLLFSVE